jgi:[protein-PII] uridylyltransferase
VRCHLHFATGRPEERLTFDLQPEIARRMGYGDRGDAPAVERFMRRYFLIAKEVGALTRAFAAKLEPSGSRTSPRAFRACCPAAGCKRKPLDVAGFHEDRRAAQHRRAGRLRGRSRQPAAAVQDRRRA